MKMFAKRGLVSGVSLALLLLLFTGLFSVPATAAGAVSSATLKRIINVEHDYAPVDFLSKDALAHLYCETCGGECAELSGAAAANFKVVVTSENTAKYMNLVFAEKDGMITLDFEATKAALDEAAADKVDGTRDFDFQRTFPALLTGHFAVEAGEHHSIQVPFEFTLIGDANERLSYVVNDTATWVEGIPASAPPAKFTPVRYVDVDNPNLDGTETGAFMAAHTGYLASPLYLGCCIYHSDCGATYTPITDFTPEITQGSVYVNVIPQGVLSGGLFETASLEILPAAKADDLVYPLTVGLEFYWTSEGGAHRTPGIPVELRLYSRNEDRLSFAAETEEGFQFKEAEPTSAPTSATMQAPPTKISTAASTTKAMQKTEQTEGNWLPLIIVGIVVAAAVAAGGAILVFRRKRKGNNN